MAGQVSRREFLATAAVAIAPPRRAASSTELRCDVAVIGGGTGGCAAAWHARS